MRTLTAPPQAEVIGQSVAAFANNLNTEQIIPLLKKHGLYPVDPATWYPVQKWMEVLNELSQTNNMSANYVAIGMSVVETMVVPPEMEKLPLGDILMGWNDLYQVQHRNADIGYVKTVKMGEKHYRTIHHHLYPDDFTYGVAYGLAKRWRPAGSHFTVMYAEGNANMDDGGQETVIDVMWD